MEIQSIQDFFIAKIFIINMGMHDFLVIKCIKILKINKKVIK